jgi:hypothetical protein
MICISILQGGACPIAADFELGLERYAEAVGFTGFAGMADEDFPYLLSDLWPANSYDLVVDPKRDPNVVFIFRPITEARAQLGVDRDEPGFTNYGFARGDNSIQCFEIGLGRNASSVEPFNPAVLTVLARETCTQLP